MDQGRSATSGTAAVRRADVGGARPLTNRVVSVEARLLVGRQAVLVLHVRRVVHLVLGRAHAQGVLTRLIRVREGYEPPARAYDRPRGAVGFLISVDLVDRADVLAVAVHQ